MSRGLYRLVWKVQTGGVGGRATRHIVKRKQVMFASLVKGGDDLSRSSYAEPSALIIKGEIVGNNNNQWKGKRKNNELRRCVIAS